jgi:hypothetical protein
MRQGGCPNLRRAAPSIAEAAKARPLLSFRSQFALSPCPEELRISLFNYFLRKLSAQLQDESLLDYQRNLNGSR